MTTRGQRVVRRWWRPPAAVIVVTSVAGADLTLTDLLPLLARRRLAARELVDACVARVERLDGVVKAFVTTTFDQARAGSAAADEARPLEIGVALDGDITFFHRVPPIVTG